MGKKKMRAGLACLALAAAILIAAVCAAESWDQIFVENEWNYADSAMDISGGIPDNATGVMDRIRRNGVLRVATEPFFAPFEFVDPDLKGQEQYAGADMMLARLIAERMGVELEIIPMEFTQVMPALNENQCDLTISAIAFTPGRASTYALSKGYYFPDNGASVVFIIREEDQEEINSVEALEDKVIIAQSNSLQEAMASEHVYSYKEFHRAASAQAVYEAVKSGQADAGVVDLESAETYIKNNPNAGLIIAGGMNYKLEEHFMGYRVAAKKGELQLIYFVNGVINEATEYATYDTWVEQAEKRAEELGM